MMLKNNFNISFAIIAFLFFSISVNSQVISDSKLKFNITPRNHIGLNITQTKYADLDGDGFLDVVAVSGTHTNPDPGINILFGKAGGGFIEPVHLPTGFLGQTIAIGDLNNDGKPELAVAGWYQNVVAVFVNQGNRQFAAPVYSIPPDPPYPGLPYGEFFEMAIADFDGDGRNDVVALQDQTNQRLRFFHFNNDSSLTVFATLNQLAVDTSYEGLIQVGDINGDTRPDLVLAGGGPFGVRNVSFVFGQPVGGNLTMTWGFQYIHEINNFRLADMDRDGDQDIIAAFNDGTARHFVQVFRNDGNASFTPLSKTFLDYPFPPIDLDINDFNNDSYPDVAVLIGPNSNEGNLVMVMNGREEGGFTEGRFYAVAETASIASGDFDHDNKIDLILSSSKGIRTDIVPYQGESNNTVSILYNDESFNFNAPKATLWGPNIIDAGDFDNDGYLDMASSWATEFTGTSGVDILINDQAEGLFPEVHYASPYLALKDMKTGDFNGDGKWDAVSAHDDNSRVLAVHLGTGTGTLGSAIPTQFTHGLLKISVGDFNNDGKTDVFAINDNGEGHSMLSAGDGTFSSAPGPPIYVSAAYLPEIGDFNGDNNLDLVLTSNAAIKLWLGDGMGRFTESSAVIPQMSNIISGDFNGDGNLDLAGMTGPPNYSNYITGVLGDGHGGFSNSFSKEIRNYSFNTVTSIASADFDLDGFDDIALVMRDNSFGNLIVIPSGGNSPSWRQPIFYSVTNGIRMLVAKDFNNDGKTDLGFLSSNARGVIYNRTSTPKSNEKFDFDGDSKTDVSIFRPSSGEWWYRRSSDNVVPAFQFGNSSDVITPADFTGDGKTDVAFFRPSTGFWYVLRSEDSNFYSFPFGASGDIPTPADFDGDGKADVAVYRPSNSTWYILNSSGGTTIATFGTTGDLPVAADYDGDGKADIGIFRPSNGQWWINRSSAGLFVTTFGVSTDKTVPADYTGDGKTDIAFFRPSTGVWYILQSEDFGFYAFPFGANGDTPAPGDYDGDGRADAAVFRPSNTTWYLQQSTSGFSAVGFGANGDIPTPSAFVR